MSYKKYNLNYKAHQYRCSFCKSELTAEFYISASYVAQYYLPFMGKNDIYSIKQPLRAAVFIIPKSPYFFKVKEISKQQKPVKKFAFCKCYRFAVDVSENKMFRMKTTKV